MSGRDPFLVEGPALISFSGGRTSAYMLRRILDAGLQPDVHVVFADTGKEREETYQFVRECERRWNVPVAWVHRAGYFDQLILDKKALPNTVQRFCTEKLKLAPIWEFGKARFDHWASVIGIRHDEPRRVAKIRGRKPMSFEDVCLPLADARVTLAEVSAFWGGATVRPAASTVGRELRSLLPEGAGKAPADHAGPAGPRRLVDREGTADAAILPRAAAA